jgi:hypothetical protein
MRGRLLPMLTALWAGACATASGSRPSQIVHTPAALPSDADAHAHEASEPEPLDLSPSFAQLEQTLLELDFAMRFDVEATGVIAARIAGELRIQGDELRLAARGSLGDRPVELTMHADGRRLVGSNGTARLEIAQPPALREAIVLGLTRMGILHNLAVLASARPPDHADGGVAQWVEAVDVGAGARVLPEALTEASRRQHPTAVSFSIVVAGQAAGAATLWWDSDRLPIERHQIVSFDEGEMQVRETYTTELLRRVGRPRDRDPPRRSVGLHLHPGAAARFVEESIAAVVGAPADLPRSVRTGRVVGHADAGFDGSDEALIDPGDLLDAVAVEVENADHLETRDGLGTGIALAACSAARSDPPCHR